MTMSTIKTSLYKRAKGYIQQGHISPRDQLLSDVQKATSKVKFKTLKVREGRAAPLLGQLCVIPSYSILLNVFRYTAHQICLNYNIIITMYV